MSVFQYPETNEDPDLQIWTNDVFGSEDSGESAAIKAAWCPLQPIFVNQSETLDLKENKMPAFSKSLPSVNSPMPIKFLELNTVNENSHGKPIKLLFKQGLISPTSMAPKTGKRGSRDGNKIDTEIEEIELEMNRLASKLEALRLRKEELNLKTTETRGRIISAKFMEPKQSLKNKGKSHRRGVSLGPSEIYGSGKFRPSVMKQETTPIPSTQYRRKSCFWKLEQVNEDKVTKERGGIISVQPKKLLFKEGENSVSAKKPTRIGRVVASRYNQASEQRKKRASSVAKSRAFLPECNRSNVNESRVKRRWEIPSETMRNENLMSNSPTSMAGLLPKIRTLQSIKVPRDPGAAKKVEDSVCQVLNFEEEEEE